MGVRLGSWTAAEFRTRMKSVSVERGPDQMPRLLGRVGEQPGTRGGGLRALRVMGVLLLLLVGCAPGAGDKAPREAGQPVEEVPARGGRDWVLGSRMGARLLGHTEP